MITLSNMRDIPSNQEVYLDDNGLTSVIIEILEYACPPEHACETDEAALKYHYADMVAAGYTTARADEEESTKFWGAGDISIPSLMIKETDTTAAQESKKDVRVLGIVGTQTPLGQDEDRKTDFTALLTTLVRLPAKQTDILITISVPHAKGEYEASSINMEAGQWGKLIEAGIEVRKEIWRSFEIKDWTLFDG